LHTRNSQGTTSSRCSDGRNFEPLKRSPREQKKKLDKPLEIRKLFKVFFVPKRVLWKKEKSSSCHVLAYLRIPSEKVVQYHLMFQGLLADDSISIAPPQTIDDISGTIKMAISCPPTGLPKNDFDPSFPLLFFDLHR
ncbi:hypothetical protein AVEN_2719-1, partial [Araneus ventricosus]